MTEGHFLTTADQRGRVWTSSDEHGRLCLLWALGRYQSYFFEGKDMLSLHQELCLLQNLQREKMKQSREPQ